MGYRLKILLRLTNQDRAKTYLIDLKRGCPLSQVESILNSNDMQTAEALLNKISIEMIEVSESYLSFAERVSDQTITQDYSQKKPAECS